MASFHVDRAGPLVSVQAAARRGQLRFGVPESGAMDGLGLAAANLALGNPADAPAIEISIAGLTLTCTSGATCLALAGGGFVADLDGQRFGSWSVVSIRAGQRLTIRPGPWGSWAYLAFPGGLKAPTWLGTAATHMLSGLGGGAIRQGQSLFSVAETPPLTALRPIPCPVLARPRPRPRVVLGPQDRFFSNETLTTFLSDTFQLSSAYDRMGVRLRGPSLRPSAALSMPSEAILRGSIQVAGDGVATVLLADHQTTGGYPKIATILSCDLDGFSQLSPRSAVAFAAVDPARAIEISRIDRAARQRYFHRIAGLALRP